MKQSNLIIILIIFLVKTVLAQQAPPSPLSYLSIDGSYLAEIFPSVSKVGSYSKARCYVYKVKHLYSYDNYNPKDRFELVWDENLVYDDAPYEAIISRNGYLVTLDDYRHVGRKHALVIYNPEGDLVKDFSLEELIPYDDINTYIYDFEKFECLIDKPDNQSINAVPADTGSGSVVLTDSAGLILVTPPPLDRMYFVPSFGIQIDWRYKARYFFTNPEFKENERSWWYPTHLYILLSYGKVIDVSLKDGINKYGELSEFSDLERLLKKQYIDDEVKINKTNLDYSSVTELLKYCK